MKPIAEMADGLKGNKAKKLGYVYGKLLVYAFMSVYGDTAACVYKGRYLVLVICRERSIDCVSEFVS